MFKKEKLYKIVYKTNSYYDRQSATLLVVGTTPVRAMKKFYDIVGTSVRDITEFIEIRTKEEGKNIE